MDFRATTLVNESVGFGFESPTDSRLNENYILEVMENRRVSYTASSILTVVYSFVIVAGSVGNGLVIWAFFRQPAMHTLHNTFIVNLAVSDLLLCLVTMPLTLLEIITKYWPLGDSVIGCKMAGGLQAVSVFVSTMSITAIALDRYQLIIYPTRDCFKRVGTIACLFSIWSVSFLLASPIFVVRALDHHVIRPPLRGLVAVDYCFEDWPIAHGRAFYSFASLIVQYAAPIMTVSIVHLKIRRRLQVRQQNMAMRGSSSRKTSADQMRFRRLNKLLLTIASIFGVCWMPLNVYNLVLDLHNPFQLPQDQETMLVTYAVCHLLGMSSAFANPFLYGWLNDNFRREFGDIASSFVGLLSICGRKADSSVEPPGAVENDSAPPRSNYRDEANTFRILNINCSIDCSLRQPVVNEIVPLTDGLSGKCVNLSIDITSSFV